MMSNSSTQSDPTSPAFSIILPTYNRAEWLDGAIKSVLNQSFQNWELIVIDDGSTDSTETVVTAVKDHRIRYIYQDNAERSAARNRGMAESRGGYITFLDSDDRYTPQHLDSVFAAASKSPDSVIVSRAVLIDGKGGTIGSKGLNLFETDVKTILLNSIGTSQICFPAAYRKSFQFNVDLNINEDTDFLIRAMEFLTLTVLNTDSVQYTVHDSNSVSLGGELNVYKERLRSLEHLVRLKSCQVLSRKERNALLSNCYFGIAKHHALRGETLATRRTLLGALLRFPRHRQKEKLYGLLFPSVLEATKAQSE